MSYKLKHDFNKCDGCGKCVEACKKAHDGVSNNAIFSVNGKYAFFTCVQCPKPACAAACPVGALRREDGVVRLFLDLCVGCLNCVEACLFGVPKFNPYTGKINKCDVCIDRVKNGEDPYCVSACPTGALKLIKVEPKKGAKKK